MRSQLLWHPLAIPLVVVTAACASSPEGRSGRECALAAADSVFIGAQPLYRDCSVDRPAQPVTVRVDFSPPMPTPTQRGTTCYSAEVQFVVGADGRPERNTIRLVRPGTDRFADAVLQAVPNWVYTPAVRGGVPVRQLVRARPIAATAVVAVPAGQGRPAPPPPPNC
jgi:hypothetical protein